MNNDRIVRPSKPIKSRNEEPSVWVIQRKPPIGDIHASLGIAERLTTTPKLIYVEDIAAAGGIDAYVKQLREKAGNDDVLPDIVITTRARAQELSDTIALKKMSGGHTFIVAFRDRNPEAPNPEFDVSFMPDHEVQAKPPNLKVCNGMPHRVTPAMLEKGRTEWRDQFSGYDGLTKIAVMVGGDSIIIDSEKGGGEFTVAEATKLGKELNALAKQQKACLLITNSHRTSEASWQALCKEITDVPAYFHHYQLDAAKGNPYYGLLALADVLIPTADSLSMCMECCSTGKPVYIAGMGCSNVRSDHRRFAEDLIQSGQARTLERYGEPWPDRPPVNDTAGEIAKEIRRRLQNREASR